MNRAIILLLSIVFVACGTQNTEEKLIETNDTIEFEQRDVPMQYSDFDAVSIGNKLKLRSEPNSNSEVVTQYDTGKLLKIIDQTSEREVLTKGDMCDEFGYYWYKVSDAEHNTGWVYGKYLFGKARGKEDKIYSKSVEINGKIYLFDSATDLSYGPSDENGLTGCDMLYMPFFYVEGESAVMPVFFNPNKVNAPDLDWKARKFDNEILLLVASSEGGSDDIDDIVGLANNQLKIKFNFYFQDGMNSAEAIIKFDERFSLTEYSDNSTGFTSER